MNLSTQWRPAGRSAAIGLVIISAITVPGCGGSGDEPAPSAEVSEEQSQSSAPAETPPAPVEAATPVADTDDRGKGKSNAKDNEEDKKADPAPADTTASVEEVPSGTPTSSPAPVSIGFGIGANEDDGGSTFRPVPASAPPANAAATTSRPDSLDAWTDDDFLSAAREHDPRILDAIDIKVKSSPGDAKVAVLLVRLLDPTLPSPAANPAESTSASSPAESATEATSDTSEQVAPQSSIRNIRDTRGESNPVQLNHAVDSATAMIMEAAVTWMPQGAAVAVAINVKDREDEEKSGKSRDRKSKKDRDDDVAAPPGAPAATGAPVAGSLQDRQLVEHVVDALIANNSQDAWQSVFGIVAGTVKTALPADQNCEIVVERLIQNMDLNPTAIQPVMLTILAGEASIPPENRTAYLRMLTAISAARMDQLTGFADALQVSNNAADGLGNTPEPAAGGALLSGSFGRSRGKDEDDRPSQGFGAVVGNAPIAPASSLPEVSLGPEAMERATEFLKSPESVTKIVQQLQNATDLSAASDLIHLASTIPVAEVRQSICAAFLRLHATGSSGLNRSGLFNQVHDPALLVILKSLPRTRPSKDDPGAMDSWTSGMETLVLSLRNELRQSAGSMNPYTDSFPVKLHKNATADLTVMKEIPTRSDETVDATDPASMQVYFTRTSFAPQRQRDIDDLTDHYEGRTSGFSRPDPAKGVMWIEGVKALTNGHRRSMDVVIEKAGSGNGGFVVEIIVVDTLDPKVAGGLPTSQASAE